MIILTYFGYFFCAVYPIGLVLYITANPVLDRIIQFITDDGDELTTYGMIISFIFFNLIGIMTFYITKFDNPVLMSFGATNLLFCFIIFLSTLCSYVVSIRQNIKRKRQC